MKAPYIILLSISVLISSNAHADETPQECKQRLKSELSCMASQMHFRLELCGAKLRGARLAGTQDAYAAVRQCSEEAKATTKQFYDAAMKSAKTKEAKQPIKDAMATWMAMIGNLPAKPTQEAELDKLLAAAELER